MAKLTKTAVEALQPGEIRWDESPKGFGARRRASGSRFYFVKYRTEQGRQRWVTIGRHGSPWTVETARRKALSILGLVADDEDPAARRDWEGEIPTLKAFAETYLDRHARKHKRPRTVAEDERNLKLHILPALGAIRIDAITTADVARFHADGHDNPFNANRCRALLSHMMRLAEKWGLRPQHSNPCRDVEPYAEPRRERFLSAAELARLGKALAEDESSARSPFPLAALRVLMFTGARKSEITRLRWEQVDLSRGVARRDAKAGRRNIHLPAPALAIIKSLPRLGGSPWVFPGRRNASRPVGDVDDTWQRVRTAAGLGDVRIHDLRHGFASVAAAAGDSLVVIGALLGHKHAATTQRYAHLSTDPVAAAAQATARRITQALDGRRQTKRATEPMRAKRRR